MLSHAGFDTDAAAGALTTFSLLEVGALLALPVVALTGLDMRLLSERDTIRSVLGHNWWQALLLTVGRL